MEQEHIDPEAETAGRWLELAETVSDGLQLCWGDLVAACHYANIKKELESQPGRIERR